MQQFLPGTASSATSALEKGIGNLIRGHFGLLSNNDIDTTWNAYLTGDIQQGVVDLLGKVVSIVDPDPQNGEAIWEIDPGNGSSVVSVFVAKQIFVTDGVAIGDLVEVEAFIVDDTFVVVDFSLQNQVDDNEN